jgi:UDP-GlcNAc3NAcA epimerase
MQKLLTIIGARPQIIKAAALSRAIRADYSDQIREVILHTGQHYDANMSQVFFDEMGIPPADYNLNVGSGSHGKQTAEMLKGIEEVLLKEKPDWIILYGDTNSTLAGAVAASKVGVPVAHVEAGLRSFNKSMPEEINRITCDHCSTLLFTPTSAGLKNLQREGFSADNKPPYTIDQPGIFHCGDVMYDNTLFFAKLAEEKIDKLQEQGVKAGQYILGTIHRDHNTDHPGRLSSIFESLLTIADEHQENILLPLHPRTIKMLEQQQDLLKKIRNADQLKIIEPASYLEMSLYEKYSSMIITDSGGVQKESYFHQKPCIILRPETEWVEIVENGSAIIADADKEKIVTAYMHFKTSPPLSFPNVYGDGKAAWFILNKILGK